MKIVKENTSFLYAVGFMTGGFWCFEQDCVVVVVVIINADTPGATAVTTARNDSDYTTATVVATVIVTLPCIATRECPV